jgi:predicted transcriptional regulator
MEVRFTPEIQAEVERWAEATGRPVHELLEDALAGYLPELAKTRDTLDSRYDDLKNGRVKPISAEEVEEHFRAKRAERRAEPNDPV